MKLKRFENIDSFEEEDWDEEEFDISKNEEDYWIVKRMGDDLIYFTKRIKIPFDKKYGGKQFYEEKYNVLEKDHHDNYVFTNRYQIDKMNSVIPLSIREIHSILNDKIQICTMDLLRVVPYFLSEICKILNVDKNYIKFNHI